MVGVHPLDEDRYADEADLAEEGQREAEAKLNSDENEVSWLRFTGTSRFRREAAQGDTGDPGLAEADEVEDGVRLLSVADLAPSGRAKLHAVLC